MKKETRPTDDKPGDSKAHLFGFFFTSRYIYSFNLGTGQDPYHMEPSPAEGDRGGSESNFPASVIFFSSVSFKLKMFNMSSAMF